MRSSSKYIIGGLFVLLILGCLWYIFGSPSTGRQTRNFAALLIIGVGCIFYGVFLRFTETPETKVPDIKRAKLVSVNENTGSFGRKRTTIGQPNNSPAMPFGDPLSDNERRDFEKALRPLLESRPFGATEEILRSMIERVKDPYLTSALAKPSTDIYIEGLEALQAAMEAARSCLPSELGNEPWRAMILKLVHRNEANTDMTIVTEFALSADPEPLDDNWRRSKHTDAQHAEWLRNATAMGRLPVRPHFGAQQSSARARLIGLEGLLPVYDRHQYAGDPWEQRTSDLINGPKTLAAALVALRFCQAAERVLTNRVIDPPLPTYLTVDSASRPMETSTVDYCTHFVRKIGATVGLR